MTRETKIGLLVGLAFILLFGIILSEKGTKPGDQLNTPPIAAFKPVVELVPPSTPAAAQLTKNNTGANQSNDSTDPLTMSSSEANDSTNAPVNNVLKPVETVAPAKPQPQTPVQDLSPNFKKLLPPVQTKSLSQIPAANPTVADVQAVTQKPTEVKPLEIAEAKETKPVEAVELKTHTIQKGETLASICRQYYPSQPYEMLKQVKDLNKIAKPEKLMVGQVINLPAADAMTDKPALADKTGTDKAAHTPGKEKSLLASSDMLVPADDATLEAMLDAKSDGKTHGPALEKLALKSKTDAAKATGGVKVKAVAKTYEVQSSDTLMKISRRVYGTDKMWTKIYELNKKVITDPRNLKKGVKLKMPPGPIGEARELAAAPKVE